MDDSGTRWLDAHQQRQWRALVRGMALLNEHLDRDLHTETGLSLNEYEVMVRLSEVPEWRMRMSTLADEMVHSRSRLSHTVSRMEKKGLVNRCKDDGDGRGIQCTLTDAGYAALQAASHTHVSSVRRRLVDVVTDEELTTLGTAFTKMANAIEGVVESGAQAPPLPWEPESEDIATVDDVATVTVESAGGRGADHIRAAEAPAGPARGEPASD